MVNWWQTGPLSGNRQQDMVGSVEVMAAWPSIPLWWIHRTALYIRSHMDLPTFLFPLEYSSTFWEEVHSCLRQRQLYHEEMEYR